MRTGTLQDVGTSHVLDSHRACPWVACVPVLLSVCLFAFSQLETLRAKYEERYKATQASATRLVAEEKALQTTLVRGG